jgi:hypothetical protein
MATVWAVLAGELFLPAGAKSRAKSPWGPRK